MKSNLIPLTGLWKSTTNDGKEYLSGSLNPKIRLMVFPNRYKTEDKHPDYQVFICENSKREEKPAQTRDQDTGDWL